MLPLIPKGVVGRFSDRYIAGSTLEEAVDEVRSLTGKGLMATVDILGENVTCVAEAEKYAKEYIDVLEAVRVNGLDSNISIKLTMLGLSVDSEFCYQRMREVVTEAEKRKNFVRIDIEDSPVIDATFDLFRRLRGEFSNVGTAVQAYMRRTQDDVTEFLKTGENLRVCKGIYVEPRGVAWKEFHTINANYALALRRLLERGCYVGIATHDEHLVWEAERIIRELGIERTRYEFQMLLGVEEDLRDILVKAGHRVRVYVPFGESWYAYSMRRLHENPRIAGYAAKKVLWIK